MLLTSVEALDAIDETIKEIVEKNQLKILPYGNAWEDIRNNTLHDLYKRDDQTRSSAEIMRYVKKNIQMRLNNKSRIEEWADFSLDPFLTRESFVDRLYEEGRDSVCFMYAIGTLQSLEDKAFIFYLLNELNRNGGYDKEVVKSDLWFRAHKDECLEEFERHKEEYIKKFTSYNKFQKDIDSMKGDYDPDTFPE